MKPKNDTEVITKGNGMSKFWPRYKAFGRKQNPPGRPGLPKGLQGAHSQGEASLWGLTLAVASRTGRYNSSRNIKYLLS